MLIASQDQGLEFHKRATTADDRARLAREADFLGTVHHPGIVEMLPPEDDSSDRGVLRLRAVDGRALDSLTLDPPSAAGLGAAVATILADLHDLGLAHGSCEASHVLVTRNGGPVLCSFGRYSCRGDKGLAAAQREDIRGLTAAVIDSFPIPVAGEGRRLRRCLQRGRSGHPPSARALARQLAEAVPSCRLPTWEPDASEVVTAPDGTPAVPAPGSETSAHVQSTAVDSPAAPKSTVADSPAAPESTAVDSRCERARRRRLRPFAAVLVAAGVIIGAALWVATGNHPHRRTASPSACPAVDAGCRPVADRHGTITTDGRSWSLGQAGDVVVLGRWRCGPALPALLRPLTGQVWVFTNWATSAAGTPGTPVATLIGATSLVVVPGSHGCDGLAVIARGRLRQVLSPGGLP